MAIPIIYEVPLFIFVALAIFTIYQLVAARRYLAGALREPYLWFIIATILFTLWGIDHIYNDLVQLPENLQLFFHYGISHGFLLVSMVCIVIAAFKTKKIYESLAKGFSKKEK